jgi:hypothetical protein
MPKLSQASANNSFALTSSKQKRVPTSARSIPNQLSSHLVLDLHDVRCGSCASVQPRPIHVGFTPHCRRMRCDAANELNGRKTRHSACRRYVRCPFQLRQSYALPRTGDKDYETGFCFCVLGCPLKGYFARLNTNSRVTRRACAGSSTSIPRR